MVIMHISPSCYAKSHKAAALLEVFAPHVSPKRYADLLTNGGRIVMPSAESARQLTHLLIWDAQYTAGILLEQIGEL